MRHFTNSKSYTNFRGGKSILHTPWKCAGLLPRVWMQVLQLHSWELRGKILWVPRQQSGGKLHGMLINTISLLAEILGTSAVHCVLSGSSVSFVYPVYYVIW